jgi:hypothetical protein
MRSLLVTVAAAGLAFAIPSIARADEKAACVGAYEQAQHLRTDNKLREAREQLVVCTRDACPKLIRKDCTKWMEEVTASLPSLVFAAKDDKGQDRVDVRVLVDGKPLTEQLGQEVIVDPGVHAVRFEAAGAEPVEQQVVVRAGEKGRVVSATLLAPAAPPPAPAPVPVKEAPPPRPVGPTSRPLPVLVPVLGGVGVAALGTGAFLALSAGSQLSDLRSKCAPHCAQSDVDAVNLRYTAAAITAGVGVVAIGTAVWLFMGRPSVVETRVGVTSFDVSPSGATLRGRF